MAGIVGLCTTDGGRTLYKNAGDSVASDSLSIADSYTDPCVPHPLTRLRLRDSDKGKSGQGKNHKIGETDKTAEMSDIQVYWSRLRIQSAQYFPNRIFGEVNVSWQCKPVTVILKQGNGWTYQLNSSSTGFDAESEGEEERLEAAFAGASEDGWKKVGRGGADLVDKAYKVFVNGGLRRKERDAIDWMTLTATKKVASREVRQLRRMSGTVKCGDKRIPVHLSWRKGLFGISGTWYFRAGYNENRIVNYEGLVLPYAVAEKYTVKLNKEWSSERLPVVQRAYE